MARQPMLTRGERSHIRGLHRAGHSATEIGRQISRAVDSVLRVLRADRSGVAQFADWEPGPKRLSLADREEIFAGLIRGETFSAIARGIGRPPCTVSREVGANGGRTKYRPSKAHRRALA